VGLAAASPLYNGATAAAAAGPSLPPLNLRLSTLRNTFDRGMFLNLVSLVSIVSQFS
jgi:hypothetical protein